MNDIELGREIYNESLRDRSGGFHDMDLDEEIWDEIYSSLGRAARINVNAMLLREHNVSIKLLEDADQYGVARHAI